MATITVTKTWAADEANFKSSDLNTTFDELISGMTPANCDDYSANVTQQKANTDAGEVGLETALPTTLAGEIERLRFSIKDTKGTDQWYTAPDTNLAAIATNIAAVDVTKVNAEAKTIVSPTVNCNNFSFSIDDFDSTNCNTSITNLAINNLTAANITFSGNLTLANTGSVTNSFAHSVIISYTRNVTTDGTNPGLGGISTSNYINYSGTNLKGGWNTVPDVSCTITTAGNPVMIMLNPDNSTNISVIGARDDGGSGYLGFYLALFKDATEIAEIHLGSFIDELSGHMETRYYLPSSSFKHLDMPAAGTYTYTLKIKSSGYSLNEVTPYIGSARLVVYEI